MSRSTYLAPDLKYLLSSNKPLEFAGKVLFLFVILLTEENPAKFTDPSRRYILFWKKNIDILTSSL